jgi:succinate dehydrogenase/fumarate reductase flavoprotein subunit
VVSRSSYMEIMAGRGSPSGGVFIDGSHLGEEFLLTNFPGMVERCADYGFDLLHDRVEISPSAHFQMGGVEIDVECRTSLDGLFVAGEDAGGVHGANRLGGNGVADSIVFGGCAGDSMSDYVVTRTLPAVSAAQVDALVERWARPLARTGAEKAFGLRKELEDLMWEKVGVVRNGPDLETALDALAVLRERSALAGALGSPASNPAWNALLDVINLCDVGQMVAEGARIRTESRGAHYRLDHPTTEPEWLKNIFMTPKGDALDVHFAPVRFTRLQPPELAGTLTHGNDLR